MFNYSFRIVAGNTKGFTLVELVIIIVIIGISSVVLIPKFFNKSDFDNRFFYVDVLNAVQYAEKLAVGSGCDVQLNITGGNTLTLNQRVGCIVTNGFTVDVRHPGTGATTYVLVAPSGLTFSSSVNPFYFDSQGRAVTAPNTTTNVVITVGTEQVNVEGITGYAYDPSA